MTREGTALTKKLIPSRHPWYSRPAYNTTDNFPGHVMLFPWSDFNDIDHELPRFLITVAAARLGASAR